MIIAIFNRPLHPSNRVWAKPWPRASLWYPLLNFLGAFFILLSVMDSHMHNFLHTFYYCCNNWIQLILMWASKSWSLIREWLIVQLIPRSLIWAGADYWLHQRKCFIFYFLESNYSSNLTISTAYFTHISHLMEHYHYNGSSQSNKKMSWCLQKRNHKKILFNYCGRHFNFNFDFN